ncbi:DNA/RNA non-specific endonuclease [Burkholderia ambifaria MC40-6]|jgi:endonuclease G|uniref:DNA/RNA non-specific endonuclease n=1 Tax=Burkholderia ambifaria (strain MC40-6) TaxID=398577 RepID=B1YXU9_BURA4|nr:DNA/RNA non-specific endonuclease [Burkholderia ambifaria]ACB65649.1 DNA/RNA non-specific endonuclease [Burkholderia ambifaria MC40-6]
MKADLSKTASLKLMKTLGALALESEKIEKPGNEPTSPPARFEHRNGFDREFLNGWRIELPIPKDDVRELRRGGTGGELKYQNFSVVMSASRRLPRLTAVNIDGSQSRRVPRKDLWRYDGRLDKGDQWGEDLYYGKGLDRGHMVRREDPVWGDADVASIANDDTFHFTNACPQMPGVNQKTWVGLENYVLANARAEGMKVNVFTGPVLTDGDLEYGGGLIPLSFWKIVAIVDENGRPSATAYVVSQESELSELEFVYGGYKTYQISVAHVMDLTDIDFSALAPYDGFSEYESVMGQKLKEPLDSLDQVRI